MGQVNQGGDTEQVGDRVTADSVTHGISFNIIILISECEQEKYRAADMVGGGSR